MVEILKAIKKAEPESRTQSEKTSAHEKKGDVHVSPSGWISPKYSQCRSVILDPQMLEENRLISMLPESPDSDYYKVLRAQIQQRLRENGWKTVMVTSAHSGEGKSMTAINLAAMFAKEYDQTVILVDADLKSQSIHRYLGYDSTRGLHDYLTGNCTLQETIVWPGVEKFCVISGGQAIQTGTEVLNSPRMRALVREMRNRYPDRYVFFDVPPVLSGDEAMVFASFVDAVVMVVEDGKTAMPDIQRAVNYLPKHKFLGFVMNRH